VPGQAAKSQSKSYQPERKYEYWPKSNIEKNNLEGKTRGRKLCI
jgi:hypothetical protein